MNRFAPLALAALLLWPAAGHAAFGKKKKAPPMPGDAAAEESPRQVEPIRDASAVDKKRFEAYLKDRLAKINEHHQARMEFWQKESETWNSFWSKVRDERKVFEIRITRQTLDLFESLASLDPKDQPQTIADFQKMQANVLKSFESQQKQKTAEFFAARDERWKEFAAQQEQEREQFIAEAQSDWQQSRTSLRGPEEAASPRDSDEPAALKSSEDAPSMPGFSAPAGSSDDAASADETPAPVARSSRKGRGAPSKSRRSDAADSWH